MSLASDARAKGFTRLLAIDGETLIFRGAEILGLVDRTPEDVPGRPGIDHTARDASKIEVLKTSLTTKPVANEVFTDAFGDKHRIQTWKQTDSTYRFACKVS